MNISRGFGVHKARKGPEITSLTWKVERPREWKSWKVATRDAREDYPNDENGDELDKRERDY